MLEVMGGELGLGYIVKATTIDNNSGIRIVLEQADKNLKYFVEFTLEVLISDYRPHVYMSVNGAVESYEMANFKELLSSGEQYIGDIASTFSLSNDKAEEMILKDIKGGGLIFTPLHLISHTVLLLNSGDTRKENAIVDKILSAIASNVFPSVQDMDLEPDFIENEEVGHAIFETPSVCKCIEVLSMLTGIKFEKMREMYQTHINLLISSYELS